MNSIPKQAILETAKRFLTTAEKTLPYYSELDLFQLMSYFEALQTSLLNEVKNSKVFLAKKCCSNKAKEMNEELNTLNTVLKLCALKTKDFGVIIEYDKNNKIIHSEDSDIYLWYKLWKEYVSEFTDVEYEHIAACKKEGKTPFGLHPDRSLEQLREERKGKNSQKAKIYNLDTRQVINV